MLGRMTIAMRLKEEMQPKKETEAHQLELRESKVFPTELIV